MLNACALRERVEFLYQNTQGSVYEAFCNGRSRSMGTCYQLANKTCNGLFDVLDKHENSYQDIFSNFDDQIDSDTITKRTLIFRCNIKADSR